MEVLVRNAEGNLSTTDRDYAAKKLGRLDKYFHSAQKVEIVHREDKLKHKVEVTVFADGLTVRGEETDASVTAAIDLVAQKIEGRLRKLKSRLIDRHRKRGSKIPLGLEEAMVEEGNDDGIPHVIIRERKHFLLKPMSTDEAALELEMLSHPFFVFRNEQTGNVEVLYKRKDGAYGLIQPEP